MTTAVTSIDGVLLPYQREWVTDRRKVKVCEKSRRVGLSWAEAADAVLTAVPSKKAGGMDVWYVGYNKEMAEEFIRDAAQWAKDFDAAASAIAEGVELFKDGKEDKAILTFSVSFTSGFRVTALSSAPSNLRGKQGLVIIDEAAFHPNLKELMKAAFALLIWGGAVHIISTHNGVDNPFNEIISEIRAGKKAYSLHRITFADAIEQGLYRRICLTRGKAWTAEGEAAWVEEIRGIYRPNDAEELDCIPSQSTGAYFSRALVESRMSSDHPVLRLTLPEGFELRDETTRTGTVANWLLDNVKLLIEGIDQTHATYYGMDFARSSDLSVIMPLVQQTSLGRYAPFILEMRNVPFEQQKQVLFFVCDNLPNFRGGANDARGNGQYLAEVAAQRYGASRILRVMITAEWYRDNMPKYKASYEDGEITIPKDSDVLDDHRAVQLVNGVPKVPDNVRTTDRAGNKRHGDAAIAGCLAWYATLNGSGPFEYYSAPRESYSSRDLRGFIRHG